MKSRSLLLAAGFLAMASFVPACGGGGDDGGDDGMVTPPPQAPPVPAPPTPPAPPAPTPPPPPPPDAEYVEASLAPLFQLTPLGEFDRFEIFDVQMQSDDFESNQTLTSVEQKLNAIGTQIAQERGVDPATFINNEIYVNTQDRNRADQQPFRGKPSDVKFLEIDGLRKAYIPLGGDISFPGNEVAVVDLDGQRVIRRVQVGIRPQRVFADEATGLVFVCNEYSNYVSIIDARDDELLDGPDGQPVKIPTDFYCRDIQLVQRNPNLGGEVDDLFMYIANEYRASVMKYSIDVIRDNLDDVSEVLVNTLPNTDPHIPIAELTGVGKNPYRLHLNDSETQIYVTNNRGGEVALIGISDDKVDGYTQFPAASVDIVQILDRVYIASTTLQRGYLEENSGVQQVDVAPLQNTGLDGQNAQVHSGSFFDDTDSYNFEDLRNTIVQLDSALDQRNPDEIVDDTEVDAFYQDDQRVLTGALPWDIERNDAGNRIFVAMLGSDIVQAIDVNVGAGIRLEDAGIEFNTRELPSAVAIDEDNNELFAVTMGGDVLEIFNLAVGGEPLVEVDLGFANPPYPATTMEAGEYFYATARWSGDGDKSCVTCHTDRFQVDGIPYANGATAPTMPHQVKPNWNLMETENYFWNGTFVNNSYASLAYAAQSRTNCELILFALIEGPDSDPNVRVGDVNNFSSDAQVGRNAADLDSDVNCRPTFVRDLEQGIDTNDRLATLPGPITGIDFNGDGRSNFLDIAGVFTEQKNNAVNGTFIQTANGVADQLATAGLNLSRDDVSRAMDYYGVGWLRLPPNPIAQLRKLGALSAADEAKLAEGENVYNNIAKCNNCHDPTNRDAPFADNRDHGAGGGWISDFIATFDENPTLLELLPDGIPEQMEQSQGTEFTTQEINFHLDPLDFFIPFCFDDENCLFFEDPLVNLGSPNSEERLFRATLVNLADPDRGFVPGQVRGQARVNTPGLRAVWMQHNLLRHGLARSVREAILAPGHPALRDGEIGYAVDRLNTTNVHGETRDLSVEQVEALELYIQSIE